MERLQNDETLEAWAWTEDQARVWGVWGFGGWGVWGFGGLGVWGFGGLGVWGFGGLGVWGGRVLSPWILTASPEHVHLGAEQPTFMCDLLPKGNGKGIGELPDLLFSTQACLAKHMLDEYVAGCHSAALNASTCPDTSLGSKSEVLDRLLRVLDIWPSPKNFWPPRSPFVFVAGLGTPEQIYASEHAEP